MSQFPSIIQYNTRVSIVSEVMPQFPMYRAVLHKGEHNVRSDVMILPHIIQNNKRATVVSEVTS